MDATQDLAAVAPSPEPPPDPLAAASTETVRSPWFEFWRKFRRQHVAMVAGAFVLRYLLLVHRDDLGEEPEQVLLADGPILACIALWAVTSALVLALTPGARGVYNVVGPGEVPLSAALDLLGRKPIPVPHVVARPLLERMFALRVVDFPPGEIDYIQFLCTVDGARFASELGWTPQVGMRETILSVDAEA